MNRFRRLLTAFLFVTQVVSAQSVLDQKIAAAVKDLTCAEPTNEKPVTLVAGLTAEKDSIAVVVKVRMAPEWHIYQYVPASAPYIPIELILKLPESVKAVGKWDISKPFPSAHDKGVLIYENEAFFVHKAVKMDKSPGQITAGLYYQTCDLRQCLPPVEKTFELSLPK